MTGITTDSGSSGSDGITNDQTLVISGTAEANSTVSVSVDGGLPVDVTANGGGVWSYDYTATTFIESAHTVTATATDAAGNTSTTSATFNLTVDLTAPAATVVTGITNDSGSSGSDGITNDQTLVISGTAEANSTVSVSVDGGLPVDVTANGGGVWSYDYTATTLSESAHTVTATATDAAGNTSATSATFNLTVDLTAPAAPAFDGTILTNTGTTGTISAGGSTKDQTLGISGTGVSGDGVVVFNDANSNGSLDLGESLGTASVDGGGLWSIVTAALTDGTYSIKAVEQDTAGNTSGATTFGSVTIDTVAPAAPVVTGITNDSGSSGSDGITNDQTLVISGTAEANSTVSVSVDGGLPVDVTANGGGVWSYDYTATTLSEGAHTVTATATDAAGNTSATSATFNLTVDLTAPAAPVVTGITNDSGSSGSDGITNDQTLVISGTAEANSTVSVSVDGGLPVDVTANGGGVWSYDYTATTLSEGAAHGDRHRDRCGREYQRHVGDLQPHRRSHRPGRPGRDGDHERQRFQRQ